MQKVCFKCGQELPLDQFYRHKMMADGHLNKCKACFREDVKNNRLAKLDYYRSYDKSRGNRQCKEYISEYRKNYPNKYRATNMVNNAIRSKKLFQEPCVICGDSNTHAHHDDYLKPLNVRWLCPSHHRQWHIKHGEGLNG
jgi:hypothetical protein